MTQDIMQRVGIADDDVLARRHLGRLTHLFTHIRHTMHVDHVKIKPDTLVGETSGAKFAPQTALALAEKGVKRARLAADALAFSTGMRKVAALL